MISVIVTGTGVSGETAIDSKNGPGTVFPTQEEKELTEFLSEMAKRGMGLRSGEFMDLVQNIVVTEKRKTPFTNNRPSYEWYKRFMERNKDIVGLRREVLLEA
ncbi:hypothetical protein DPMN_095275 [Dreissena polymorpha]|uniref:HTH CENPB-type domain-containing protein n=1 Tax=Dreissena polymorpha TaxID=45954 RepID=A0A9D4L670_DREPO|nr:hypothetical protein DPMN_095275 [Dreissena polymorpha]